MPDLIERTDPGARNGGWVVGIDGGATRTRLLLADAAGRERGRSEAGSGLLGAGKDDEVASRIDRAVRDLMRASGGELPLTGLCAGLAGAAGSPESRRACEDRLRSLGLARVVSVTSDAEVAFLDAFGSGDGILLIAGSGSVGLARWSAVAPASEGGGPSETSGLVRVGGWGALIGDEGSAYRIGLDGVRAAVAGAEGRGLPTTLTEAVLVSIGVGTLAGLFLWSQQAEKAAMAALAPVVIGEAAQGDMVAARIREAALEGLMSHARALRDRGRSGEAQVAVALAGGLIDPGRILRARLEENLRAEGFVVRPDEVIPARGALGTALRLSSEGGTAPAR